jgi:ABC-type bacteriocin/lantibiotic exporter with double-glycine peptidase domain
MKEESVSYKTTNGTILDLHIKEGKSERSYTIIDFPEVRQIYQFDCGAAATKTLLNYFGHDVREDGIIKEAETNEDGTNPSGIIKVLEKYGLKTKQGTLTIEKLKEFIKKGYPVLILLQAWSDLQLPDYDGYEDGHYVICLGFDDKGRIIFEDPSSTQRTWLTEEELDKRWHSIGEGTDRTEHWGMIVYGKEPTYRSTNFIHMD